MRNHSSFFLLACSLPLLLAACITQGATSAAIADGTSIHVPPGSEATLADNSRLRYVRVVNDSRCPLDVQCVWAGDAIVAMEWTAPGATVQAFELHTGKEPRTHVVGQRTITLEALERGERPAATLKIETTR